jgi:hypothetical protein
MIDYNKIIDRNSIDTSAYLSKFEKVDNWLASDRKDELAYGSMLLDPTTFSYLHFRVDGKPLKLYAYQDMILNDMHRFKYFEAANQIGKSLALDAQAARNLIWDHGHSHNEAIVSKSLPQSTFQMRRIKSLLNTMPEINWKDVPGSTDSLSVISVDILGDDKKVKYSNMLICAPCTEGLLGYDLHDLDLDEFEFWDDVENGLQYFYEQIAQPRTYTTKGHITVFSNPNGKDNFGAVLTNQRLINGNRKWHVYNFNYLDKPGNTIEEYEQLKKELPRHRFESTVAAIRSISDRNYFSPDEIERSYDATLNDLKMIGKQPFFFLDVGAKHDQSVLTGCYIDYPDGDTQPFHIYLPVIHCYPVGYPLSRVVGSTSLQQDSDGWHYEKSVKEYLEEWSKDGTSPVFGCDVTGNSGIIPLFETCGIFPEDVVFSGPQKSGMYQRFKWLMEKGKVHRIASKEFDYQLSHLEMQKSGRGYLLIHHETEDDLDDVPDSIAGLIFLADPRDDKFATPSVKVFYETEKKAEA